MVARRSHTNTLQVRSSKSGVNGSIFSRSNGHVRAATKLESRQILNRRALRELGISGREFLKRLDDGEYRTIADPDLRSRVARVKMVVPFVRSTKA